MELAAGDQSPSPSFASTVTTPDGWHPRTAERRLLHLLHHCPLARSRPLELLAFAVRHALPSSPPSPHHHALAALLLLSYPPPHALPLLRLLPPDPPPPLPLLNAAVKALSASSPRLAFGLLSSLRRLHAPDRLSFLPLIGCASSLPLLTALHSLLLRLGFLSHHAISLALLKPYPLPHVRILFDEILQKNKCTVAYNTLITAHLKAKDICTARHLFDEMQRYKRSRRSVVSWNLMIAGCARCERDDMAVWCFERMLREGEVAPDDGTLAAVLPGCGRIGNAGAGRWAHEYARKTGLLDSTVHVANAVVDMYCKCGDVASAKEVFEGMPQRSVVSWNTMIAGFSLNGHGVEGIELFQKMQRQGMEPNAVTFLGVLGCCAHAGTVDVGREIFQSMQLEHGVEPVAEHYGCMVDLLGRSGLLEEAHVLIQGMPMKPNAAIWGALLSACRAHAGLGFAEVALKELINLEPWNSGNYVLLANLYAETERWEEAGEVRRLMKKMSVNKAPGQSLIEEDEFQLRNSGSRLCGGKKTLVSVEKFRPTASSTGGEKTLVWKVNCSEGI